MTRHIIRLIAPLKFLKVNTTAHHYYIFIFLKLVLYKTNFFYVPIAPLFFLYSEGQTPSLQ